MSNGPLITRPARYDAVPSCTTPLSKGGDQFEEMTRPPASSDRALLTASQPADLAKNSSVKSMKLIPPTVPQTDIAWQRSFSNGIRLQMRCLALGASNIRSVQFSEVPAAGAI